MGKLTLAILVVAVAAGVYWFWWSDQGANDPITAEGTLLFSGMSGLPGVPQIQGTGRLDFTLQAVPSKVRLSGRLGSDEFSLIFRLDKRELYILDDKAKVYATEEFDFVERSETEPKEKSEATWPEELTRTADWEYIGSGDGKRFCNKQVPEGLSEGNPGRLEVWFTPDTRLGRRYFGTINKLVRIRPVGGSKRSGTLSLGEMERTFAVEQNLKEKRPQFKYINLDFFPIPMKAEIAFGPMQMRLDLKGLSRASIPKDVFEIPMDYEEGDPQLTALRSIFGPVQGIGSQPRPVVAGPREIVPQRRATPRRVSAPRRTSVPQRRRTPT